VLTAAVALALGRGDSASWQAILEVAASRKVVLDQTEALEAALEILAPAEAQYEEKSWGKHPDAHGTCPPASGSSWRSTRNP